MKDTYRRPQRAPRASGLHYRRGQWHGIFLSGGKRTTEQAAADKALLICAEMGAATQDQTLLAWTAVTQAEDEALLICAGTGEATQDQTLLVWARAAQTAN